jgi:SSS family solute:Na+ symporter
MNRMTIVFLACVALIVIFALLKPDSKSESKAMVIDRTTFRISMPFTIGMLIVIGITAALYIVFW